MNTQTHRHRHFVALPLFLLIAGMSVADTHGDVSAMISGVVQQDDSGVPEEFYGSILDGEVMRVGSRGVSSMEYGDLRLTVFDGGMYLIPESNSVTVAALTSPVFVQHSDQRMVVPVGMQWTFTQSIDPMTAGFDDWMRARSVSPLPEHFMTEHVSALIRDRSRAESLLPISKDDKPVQLLPSESLLLPARLAEEQDKRTEHLLGLVRSTVESGDIEALEELAVDEDVAVVLATNRGRDVVARLLSYETSTPMRMALLMRIADAESVWTIASLHPVYRDVAWSLIDPEVSVESQLSRAFLFPLSLFSGADVSDFVFDRYRLTLEGMVEQVGDSTSFVEHLLDVHFPLVSRLHAKGYPRRAAQLADVLTDLVASLDVQTEAMEDAIRSLHQDDAVSIAPIPVKHIEEREPQDSAPVEDSIPEVVYSAAEVEAMARNMLNDAGALFTVKTGIAAFADNKARVSDILFSSPSGDRSVTFIIDVHTKIVSEIEIDGQSDFPYEPSFDGFVEWISLT